MWLKKFKALSTVYAARAEALLEGICPVRQCRRSLNKGGDHLKVGYLPPNYSNHSYSHLIPSVYGSLRGPDVDCFRNALTPPNFSSWRD